jgi:hypothetical protein
MGSMLRRRALGLTGLSAVWVVVGSVVAGCGTGEVTAPAPPATPVPTVPGVGVLPDTIPQFPPVGLTDNDVPVSVAITRPVDGEGVVVESVAQRVNGTRLLVIGDSILASTAKRYGNEFCDAVTPLGWDVEVNAEPARFIEFGREVVEDRIPDDVEPEDDWDAAVVHLGSNYAGDQEDYFDELNEVLYRLAPRPTLLLTVTEYRSEWVEANDSIWELAKLYDNVTVIDWEKIARTPGVLSRDGLHPGDRGEDVLVEQIAVALGSASATPGECLRSQFTDDSAVNSGSGGSRSGGSSSGGSSTGSSGGGSSGSSTNGSTTSRDGGSSSGGSSTSSSGGSSTATTTTGTSTGTTGTTSTSTTGTTGTGTTSTTGTGTTGTTGSATTGATGTATTGTGSTGTGSTGATGTATTGTGSTAGSTTTGGTDSSGDETTGGTDGTTGATDSTGATDASTGGTSGSNSATTGGATTTGTTGGVATTASSTGTTTGADTGP